MMNHTKKMDEKPSLEGTREKREKRSLDRNLQEE